MSISDLIEQSIENPPVDAVVEGPRQDEMLLSLSRGRNNAFVTMASSDEDELPATQFALDKINAYHNDLTLKRTQERVAQERMGQLQELESQVMNSSLSPTASLGVIRDMREAVNQGVAPEDLAIQELSARNALDAEYFNQEDIAYQQALQDEEKWNTQRLIKELRDSVEEDFQATIPGIEDAYEMLSSWVNFLNAKGDNVTELLEKAFGVEVGSFERWAPGEGIIEAQNKFGDMTFEQRSQAIKKAKEVLYKESGIFFDNEEDAMVLMNAIEAIAGTRVQAEGARSASTTGQLVDTLLSIPFIGLGKAAKGVSQARRARVAGQVDEGLEELTERLADGPPRPPSASNQRTVDLQSATPSPQLALPAPRLALPAPKPGQGAYVLVRHGDEAKGIKPKYRPITPHTGMPAASPGQILNEVSPRTAAPVLAAALDDTTGNIARGLGATRAQIADDVIAPVVEGEPIRRGATLITPDLTTQLGNTERELLHLMTDSKMFTPEETQNAKEGLQRIFKGLDNSEITLVSKSTPYVDEELNRVSMDYVVGAGGERSFATAEEARNFITKLPKERIKNVQVLRFEPSSNSYVPYEGDPLERGEYLLRVGYSHTRASGAVKEDVLKHQNVNILTNNTDLSVSYIKRMADSVTRLDIRQAQVQDVFKKILKPLEDLKDNKDLDAVWATLKEAEKNPVDFTHGQLLRKLEGSQPRIEAYRAVRRFYQAVYAVRNNQYREHLARNGYLSYKHADGNQSWVRSVEDSDDIVTVYWDKSGRVVDKKRLADEGEEFEIVESFQPIKSFSGSEASETKYVAIPKGKAQLDALPEQVLHNKPTYLGRHLETKYVIEEVHTGYSNGKNKEIKRVVAVASNPIDAAKAAAQGSNLHVRRAYESTEGTMDFISQELKQMNDLQMLTNTKHRLEFHELDVSRQESLLSPMESLDRVRNTMARTGVLGEWIEYQTTKWMRTYGNLIEEKGFPWGGKLNLKNSLITDLDAKAQIKRARKVRERILLTAGVHENQIAERIQETFLGTAEYLTRLSADASRRGNANMLRKMQIKGLEIGARAAAGLSTFNPVQLSKQTAHMSFIVANPIRQLIMQSTSAGMYSGIDHAGKYFATGAATRDAMFLATAKGWKDLNQEAFNNTIKSYAKLAKVSESDARKMFDEFDQSGTLGSVTSHQFLEHGFTAGGSYRNHAGTYATADAPAMSRKVGHFGKGVFDTTFRTMSHYGFEAGEKFNRIHAYLAVRNKHKVNGTLENLTPTDLGVEGLQVSGNMGQFSRAAFQQGALGIPFQFMSYSTRMLQFMMPNTRWTSYIASDTFSNKEKAKIALYQAMLFGGGGMGLGTLFTDGAKQAGIEIDPEVENAVEEGLMGLGMEVMVEAMAGGIDANIDVSETMGPLSGLTGDLKVLFADGDRATTPLGMAYKIVTDLVTGAPVGFNDISGAGGGAISNIGGILTNIDNVWMNPVLGVGEKLELQARHIAVMLPVVNNVLQARIMASSGEYMSKFGTPVAQATISEALMKGLTGINPAPVKEVYELNAELRGKKATLLAPSHREVSTSGRELANFTYNALRQLSSGQMTKQEVMDRIQASRAAVFMAYEDQTDRDIFTSSFKKELVRLHGTKETLADELVTIMANDHELRQTMGWEGFINRIERLGPSPHGEFVINKVRENMGKKEMELHLIPEAEDE